MGNDISIQKVENMYYAQQRNWCRDFFAPRTFDGLVFFVEGSIEYHFENKTITAKKGDILTLPGNLPYSGVRLTDDISIFVIDFVCASDDEFEQLMAPSVFTPTSYDVIHSKFTGALRAWEKQAIDVQLKLKSFVYSILCEAFKDNLSKKNTTPVDEILEYILMNLGDINLSVASLCRKFNISESQLRRNVVKAVGATPNEYILALRMKKAMNELTQSDKSIQQVSMECGFSSPYYFSKCFSKHTGMPPSEYKKCNLYRF